MSIEEMMKMLPEELQREVMDYVQFLLERKVSRTKGPLSFGWEGALKDLKNQYTSVELQHKISKWRIGES